VLWISGDGRKYNSIIPIGAKDADASKGVKYGPPDLDVLGLPTDVRVRLHNELFARGLFTYEQVRRNLNEVIGAIQQAVRLDAQLVSEAYYRKEHPDG
jgi:hypothetical protein